MTGRFRDALRAGLRRFRPGGIHPLALLADLEAAARTGIHDGAVPNHFVVSLSQRDARAVQDELDGLTLELGRRLRHLARQFDSDITGPLVVRAKINDDHPSRVEARTVPAAGPFGVTLAVDGGAPFAVTLCPVSIGRDPANDVVLSDPAVSRFHAEVRQGAGGYALVDTGSANGLLVDGRRVSSVPLVGGTRIVIGRHVFEVIAVHG